MFDEALWTGVGGVLMSKIGQELLKWLFSAPFRYSTLSIEVWDAKSGEV
jgi:hypothetical protein